MLILRKQQIETVIKGNGDDFIDYLVGYITTEHSEISAEFNEKTLRKMVKGGIARAESRRFTDVDDVKFFISKMFAVAPNFDVQPEINAVLEDETINQNGKIEKLQSPFISADVWKKAVDEYDKDAWFSKKPQ